MPASAEQYLREPESSGIVRVASPKEIPISQIAQEMGLTESALRNWVKQSQIDQAASPNGALTTEARQALNQLRRDNKRLQMERDFLKKTAAFCFARASLYAAESSSPMS